MSEVILSSVLEERFRETLEELLFFNAQQQKVRERIVESLERYGAPEVAVEGGRLLVRTREFPTIQALYVLERDAAATQLVGAALYVRDTADSISVVHIAVREDYAAGGARSDAMLVMRLVNAIREAAGRIKGVRGVRLSYIGDVTAQLPVCGRPANRATDAKV